MTKLFTKLALVYGISIIAIHGNVGTISVSGNNSTWQGTVATCGISAISSLNQSPCNPTTNTYSQQLEITYSNHPATGTLDVNGQFFPISGSPQSVTLTGLEANGLDVSVTARFTADTVCSYTEVDLFVSPEACLEICNMVTVLAGQTSSCNPATNTYTQQIVVVYENAPSSGTLDVYGQSFPILGSPQTVVLRGLVANEAVVDVTASFSENQGCEFSGSNLFTAPADCTPNASPLAENDTLSMESEISVDIDILGNDSDSDGNLNSGSISIIDVPANGSVIINTDGTVSYTPEDGFSGTDWFTYTVDDEEGAASNMATVVITVELLTVLDPFVPMRDDVSFYVQTDQVFVTLNPSTISKLRIDIIDVNGQLLFSDIYSKILSNELAISLPMINDKLLIVRAITNSGVSTAKLFIGNRR